MKYLSNLNVCLLFNDTLKIGKVSGRYKLDHSSHSSSRTIMVGWTLVVMGYRGILAMRERLLTSLMFLCLVSWFLRDKKCRIKACECGHRLLTVRILKLKKSCKVQKWVYIQNESQISAACFTIDICSVSFLSIQSWCVMSYQSTRLPCVRRMKTRPTHWGQSFYAEACDVSHWNCVS